jgi:predicted nucleotidyltransferase
LSKKCKKQALDLKIFLLYYLIMLDLSEKVDIIKNSILKFVPARYIFLFGSYAYGNPTEKSDIDIYIVTPDNINNFSELYARIIGDLGDRKIFFVDLMFKTESIFNERLSKSNFEKTVFKKGKMIYGY